MFKTPVFKRCRLTQQFCFVCNTQARGLFNIFGRYQMDIFKSVATIQYGRHACIEKKISAHVKIMLLITLKSDNSLVYG